jgi:hypothetical protein
MENAADEDWEVGHLPKYERRSSRAWLYGKFLIALLTQKLIRMRHDISPWGYALAGVRGPVPGVNSFWPTRTLSHS